MHDRVGFKNECPFGMLMQERSYSSGTYKCGFNGQEKDNEVSGEGNTNTAEYWEYDTRLGRRWNLDPISKAFECPFATFSNNPIINIDPLGNTDYFNNKGRYIGTDGVDNNIKMMALSKKTSKQIKQEIKDKNFLAILGYKDLIVAPTKSEVGAMRTAWKKTEAGVSKDKATSHEEGFVSGGGVITESQPGKTSTLPEKGNITGELEAAALEHYQVSKVTKLIVHTHPNVQLQIDKGLLTSAAEPSGTPGGIEGDYGAAKNMEGMYGTNVTFAVIGINVTESRADPSVKIESPVTVDFFNSKCNIGSISLKRLAKAVNKIDKHK